MRWTFWKNHFTTFCHKLMGKNNDGSALYKKLLMDTKFSKTLKNDYQPIWLSIWRMTIDVKNDYQSEEWLIVWRTF